jgi:hypothetical protein
MLGALDFAEEKQRYPELGDIIQTLGFTLRKSYSGDEKVNQRVDIKL